MPPQKWSYSGNPAENDRDAVRFLIPDTDEAKQLIMDTEIDYLLANFGGPIHAAAVACEQIAGKFSGQVTKRIGKLRIDAEGRSQQYAERARILRRMIGTDLAEVFAGGLSISEKETLAQDTDAIQPSMSIAQDDFPGNENFNARVPRFSGFVFTSNS